MTRLSGIIKLRGKNVALENLENSRLKKILHSRLRGNKFMFNIFYSDAPSYSEHKDSPNYDDTYHDTHVDRYSDRHTDRHNDNHRDKTGDYDDIRLDGEGGGRWSNHGDHIDKGHTESINYGYNEHTDGYK